MENKKTFGAYVLQRRRELGMTQKELAEKLYVTESAGTQLPGYYDPAESLCRSSGNGTRTSYRKRGHQPESFREAGSEIQKTDTELSDCSICTLWNDPGRMRHWEPGFFSYPGLVFYRSCRGDDGGFPDSGTGSCSPGSQI